MFAFSLIQTFTSCGAYATVGSVGTYEEAHMHLFKTVTQAEWTRTVISAIKH